MRRRPKNSGLRPDRHLLQNVHEKQCWLLNVDIIKNIAKPSWPDNVPDVPVHQKLCGLLVACIINNTAKPFWSATALIDEHRETTRDRTRWRTDRNRATKRAYIAKSREKANANRRAWYWRHLEEARASRREWYRRHQEEVLALQRAQYWKDPVAMRAKGRVRERRRTERAQSQRESCVDRSCDGFGMSLLGGGFQACP